MIISLDLRARARRDFIAHSEQTAKHIGFSGSAIDIEKVDEIFALPVYSHCPGCHSRVYVIEQNLQWALVVDRDVPHIVLMHVDCTEPAKEQLYIAEVWPFRLF